MKKKAFFKTFATVMCIAVLANTVSFTSSAKSFDFSFDLSEISSESPFTKLFGKNEAELSLNSAEPQKDVPDDPETDILYTSYSVWGKLDQAYLSFVKNSFTGTLEIRSEISGYPVTGIGETALSGSKVTKVIIPGTIAEIDETAFVGCSELKEIVVDESNPYYKSYNGALYNKAMTKLIYVPTKAVGTSFEIPEGVKDISMGAFADCSNFALTIPSTIYFPNNVDFLDCLNVSEFRVNGNPYVSAKDGVLMDKRCTTIFKYPVSSTRKAYTIPEGVTDCDTTAFVSVDIDAGLIMLGIIPYEGNAQMYKTPSNLLLILQEYSLDFLENINLQSIMQGASHIAVCSSEWANDFVDQTNAEYREIKAMAQAEWNEYSSSLTYGSPEYIEMEMYFNSLINPLNCHLAYWTAHTDPGCYNGSDSFSCFCGYRHTESIPALGHKFNAWRTNGSGYTRSCSVCNNSDAEVFAMQTPSVTQVKYGDTLVLHLNTGTDKVPADCAVVWEVSGSGATISAADGGMTCEVTCIDNGTVTVIARLVSADTENPAYDENGNEISVSQELTMKGGFFWKIISFFKDLFRISRVIAQFA